ncbi:uncharacterized protein LOC118427275 [Branchiostoma floridae]|uniref:Uncharacterized protein LOC118427275 n=1 Tax=Branchiostoma floridae TaxID=7739 RepID=A0A9J7N7N5_BRAFL|nr:uncharacterized protein LOC118427275 [Branchiostoma floridae]
MGYQLGDNDPKNLTDNRDEDYDHWVKYVHVTVNDTYGMTFYAMVEGKLQSQLVWIDPHNLVPEYGCDPLPNNATHLPSLEVHWNVSRAYLTVDENVPSEWFDWGSPSDRRTLLIARFQHVYSATPTVAVNCYATLGVFSVEDVTIKIYYLGCPEGKFGGQCEQNCSCPDNATCHTLNGACKCPDGRTGQFCDEAMPLTTHQMPTLLPSVTTQLTSSKTTATAKTIPPPPPSRLALRVALPVVLCLVVVIIIILAVTWWSCYRKREPVTGHTKLEYEINPLYDDEGI